MNETPMDIIRRLQRTEFQNYNEALRAGKQLEELVKQLKGAERAAAYTVLDRIGKALHYFKATTPE